LLLGGMMSSGQDLRALSHSLLLGTVSICEIFQHYFVLIRM